MSNIIETSCGYFSVCPAKTERRPGTGPFHMRSISAPHILIIPSHCHSHCPVIAPQYRSSPANASHNNGKYLVILTASGSASV